MKIVIFCGGYGTRMWPVSRKSSPKQFAKIIKGKSFFQLTVERFRKVYADKDIFVSTEEKYLHFVHEQAPGVPRENIIAEPERKDNLAAVGLVTAIIEKRFPGEVMLISWSDHFISKESLFLKAVQVAGEYAAQTRLIVSVDEKPTYPSVHNGWVELGKTLVERGEFNIIGITRHVEKPDEKTAKEMFSSGKWLINTGYRAWKSEVMLAYFQEYVPQMYQGLVKIMEADGKADAREVLEREYHQFEKESVEYAIFEKLPKDKRAVIPVEVGWEDAGTWELFYKALITPQTKTIIEGGVQTELLNSERNLIIGSKNKVIAVVGLSDIVVIDTKDGLLVCSLKDTNLVKEVFKKLEATKKKFVE